MAMSEADLQHAVLEMARLYGIRVAHFRPARTAEGWRTAVQADGAGFPDLVLAGPGGVAFRELKALGSRLTRGQVAWRGALLGAGADWSIWTEVELRGGDIQAEMAILAGKETW